MILKEKRLSHSMSLRNSNLIYMKKFAYLLFVALLFSSCSKNKSIVIFFDNDIHCAVEGYPYYAGLKNSVSSDTAYVAYVSSGDYIQGGTIGSVSRGEAIATIMKEIGYDAVTFGNHEFDYTIDHLNHLLDISGLTVTCANLVDSLGNNVYSPYQIKKYGSKEIAYIGVTTPNTYYAKPAAFKDKEGNICYSFEPSKTYDKVQYIVDEVRNAGADYVIVLSHLGEAVDSLGIESHGLIANTRGIDVVLDGHTHSVVEPTYLNNKEGKPVLIAQTGSKFSNVGRLLINADGQISASLIPVKDLHDTDSKVKQVVDSILDYYDKILNEPVGQLSFDLKLHDSNGKYIARIEEVNSGDIVADAMRYITKSDVAIVNSGSLRNPVDACFLTKGDIMNLCPYDNTVCSVSVTGAQLISILSECVKYLPLSNGNFPQVSGVIFDVVMDETPYATNVKIENANGKYVPVDKNKQYSFASTDYIFSSEVVIPLGKDFVDYNNTGVLYGDALAIFIKEKLNGIVPDIYKTSQSRIIIKK